MSRDILELSTIDVDNQTVYVGSDLSTRKILFYINENGRMIPLPVGLRDKALREIQDPNELNTVFKATLDGIVKDIKEDNINNNYDNTNLDRNWPNINIICNETSLSKSNASYEAITNTLTIELPNELLRLRGLIPLQIKATLNTILVHEISHLSVSELKIDGNRLIGKVGFGEKSFALKDCQYTSDGYKYYRIEETIEPEINEGQGLEELFNELETDKRANSNTSPGFAHELDDLTEGKLRIARQKHSLQDYYQIMQEIIPSQATAEILLFLLSKYYESLHRNDTELINQLYSAINEIIFNYQVAKAKIRKNN